FSAEPLTRCSTGPVTTSNTPIRSPRSRWTVKRQGCSLLGSSCSSVSIHDERKPLLGNLESAVATTRIHTSLDHGVAHQKMRRSSNTGRWGEHSGCQDDGTRDTA